MPSPSAGGRGLGFLRLDRNGDLVIEPTDDPFVTEVTVVFMDCILPLMLPTTYGLPDESVIEMPPLRPLPSRKPGLL